MCAVLSAHAIFVCYSHRSAKRWAHTHNIHILYMFRWSSWMVKIWRKKLQQGFVALSNIKELKPVASQKQIQLCMSQRNRNIYYKTLFIPSSSYYSCDFLFVPSIYYLFLFVASNRFPFWRFHYMFVYYYYYFRSQWNTLALFVEIFVLLFNFNHNNDCIITKWVRYERNASNTKVLMNIMNRYASSARIEEYFFLVISLSGVATTV